MNFIQLGVASVIMLVLIGCNYSIIKFLKNNKEKLNSKEMLDKYGNLYYN